MFFVREILYLDHYDQGEKRGACGSCKCQIRGERLTLDLGLGKLPIYYPVTAVLRIEFCDTGSVLEGELRLEEKKRQYHVAFSCKRENIGSGKIHCCLRLSGGQMICDAVPEKTEPAHSACDKRETDPSTQENTESDLPISAQTGFDTPISGQTVSIPDETGHDLKYYVTEPGKLGEFGDAFAHFEENSFLLHGYYNYSHLLVGPADGGDFATMSIGVPGNYYRREEVVAGMFGFMEFAPVKGQRQTGAFGYYYTPRMPVRPM
ncbi:MAG: hypothetical protein J6P60_07185 [Lachnospiraceae bacterium]|nr:hypothetical protein [Lachnospiraceae bacterium]